MPRNSLWRCLQMVHKERRRYAEPSAISNAIDYAKSYSRSHAAVIRVYDHASNVIEPAAGATMKKAIRYGVARGLFSNESGLGSAPIVAAAAQTKNPVRQALGSVLSLPTVWSLADITNGLMAIPNLISLIALKGIIVVETRRYLWSNILEEEAPPAAELVST